MLRNNPVLIWGRLPVINLLLSTYEIGLGRLPSLQEFIDTFLCSFRCDFLKNTNIATVDNEHLAIVIFILAGKP